MIRAVFWALTLVLTGNVAFAVTGMQWIARVYPDGSVGFNKLIYTTVDLVEMEISEVDGAIYRSSENGMSKLDENGDWVDGWSLPAFSETRTFDISPGDYLWIPGIEVTSDRGLYKYTSSGGYVTGVEDFNPSFASTVYEEYVWAGAHDPAPVSKPGVHRFTSLGSREYYLDNYKAYYLSAYESADYLWFTDEVNSPFYHGEVIYIDSTGAESLRLTDYNLPVDLQCDQLTGGCWFYEYEMGDVIKVSPSGGEVFRDPSFTDVAAIDVYEADGSVWVAANGKAALVHLSAGGEELLSLPFEAEMLHLAVDQRDGSCVVISDGNGLGDLNIQPSSVGRIKAMFAGEGPTSGGAGKGVYGEGKRDAPIYEHPWYGYPP